MVIISKQILALVKIVITSILLILSYSVFSKGCESRLQQKNLDFISPAITNSNLLIIKSGIN